MIDCQIPVTYPGCRYPDLDKSGLAINPGIFVAPSNVDILQPLRGQELSAADTGGPF